VKSAQETPLAAINAAIAQVAGPRHFPMVEVNMVCKSGPEAFQQCAPLAARISDDRARPVFSGRGTVDLDRLADRVRASDGKITNVEGSTMTATVPLELPSTSGDADIAPRPLSLHVVVAHTTDRFQVRLDNHELAHADNVDMVEAALAWVAPLVIET